MIEEIRKRTADTISEACRSDTPALIESPPASGKTYNAVRLAGEGHKILYLAGRTDLYNQAEEKAKEIKEEEGFNEITVETIPSPHRDCETFQGEDQNAKRAERFYAKGVSGRDLHTDDWEGLATPCHSNRSPCGYIKKLNKVQNSDIDLLVGNHQHAYNPQYLMDRIVIFDEFNKSAFTKQFPTDLSDVNDRPGEIIAHFLDTVSGLPFDDTTDLIEARVREGEEYKTALDWFRDNGADRKSIQRSIDIKNDRYQAANSVAGILTLSVLLMEKVGPEWELAYEPELWDEVNLPSGIRCVRNRSTGEIMIVKPPSFELAKQILALDAVPVKRLWEVVLGCDFNLKQVLSRDQIDEYLSDGLNLNIVRVTENRHPYSSGRISDKDLQKFAFVRANEGQRFPLITRKKALEKYKSHKWFEKYISENDDGQLQTQQYSKVLSSNVFKEEILGFVSGNPYPGHEVVKRWAALCGERVRIESRNDDSDGGFEVTPELGEKIRRHLTHDLVFQAVLRFGRTEDSKGSSTVYVNTTSLPEWVSTRNLQFDDKKYAAKKIDAIEDLIGAFFSEDRLDWQTITDIEESVEERYSERDNGRRSISGETIRDAFRDYDLGSCVQRKSGAGKNGSDLFRWNGHENLKRLTEGYYNSDHILVTDSQVIFLRLDDIYDGKFDVS